MHLSAFSMWDKNSVVCKNQGNPIRRPFYNWRLSIITSMDEIKPIAMDKIEFESRDISDVIIFWPSDNQTSDSISTSMIFWLNSHPQVKRCLLSPWWTKIQACSFGELWIWKPKSLINIFGSLGLQDTDGKKYDFSGMSSRRDIYRRSEAGSVEKEIWMSRCQKIAIFAELALRTPMERTKSIIFQSKSPP